VPDPRSSPSLFSATGTPDVSWFMRQYPDPRKENDLRLIPDLNVVWQPIGTEYTNDTIADLRYQARIGFLRQQEAFRDEMERFGISTAVEKIRSTARGSEIQFGTWPPEAEKDKTGNPDHTQAKLARDYVVSQLEDIAPDLLADTMNLFFRGYETLAPHYNVRGASINGLDVNGLDSVQEVPHRYHRVNPITKRMEAYANLMGGEPYDLGELQSRGVVMHDEIDTSHPYDQRGLHWLATNPWTAFQQIFRMMIRYVAVYGFPIFDVAYDEKTPGAQAEAIKIVNKLGSAAKVARPQYLNITYQQSSAVGQGHTVFMEALEFCLRLFDQIYCGHSQSSGQQVGAGGKNPAAKADADFVRLMNARLGRACRFIRKQLIRKMVADALGPDVAANHCPTMTASVDQEPDYKTASETLLNAVNAGFPPGRHEGYESMGFEVPDPAEMPAPPPQQQKPGAQGQNGQRPGGAEGQDESVPPQTTLLYARSLADAYEQAAIAKLAEVFEQVFNIQHDEAVKEARNRMRGAA
jgi:Protein of unknown function (DUF935)